MREKSPTLGRRGKSEGGCGKPGREAGPAPVCCRMASGRIGAGLSELDVGLRLRYEITRQFAPYVGITYLGQYGATANYVSAAGGSTQQVRFTAGVRTWF